LIDQAETSLDALHHLGKFKRGEDPENEVYVIGHDDGHVQ
jgi:hypothetical protein